MKDHTRVEVSNTSQSPKSMYEYKKHEYILYGADAEMVNAILKGDILHKLLPKKEETEMTGLIYKSLSENARDSYLAASELSVAILNNSLGINIEKLYEKLKDFENTGEFYCSYREHVVHQWRVFLLGLYIYDTTPILKSEFIQKYSDEFAKIWAATALCHDIGYLLERRTITENNYAADVVKLLNGLEEDDNGLKVFCPEVDFSKLLLPERTGLIRRALICRDSIEDYEHLFYDRDEKDQWKLAKLDCDILNFEKYNKLTTTLDVKPPLKRPCFTDHGIASAAILIHLIERKKYWSKQLTTISDYQSISFKIPIEEYLDEICQAIALHNIRPDIWDQNKAFEKSGLRLNRFKLDVRQFPLAVLLVLCDGLQEWNRPSRDYSKQSKEMNSQEIHIISTEGTIYLCFPMDVFAQTNAPDSTYIKITQPLFQLLTFNDAVVIKEIGENEMKQYIDKSLWAEIYHEPFVGEDSIESAYKIYQAGRQYGNRGNPNDWEKGKELHVNAAERFEKLGMKDWAARSLGRAAFDALDLNQKRIVEEYMNKAMELDPWQGTANYYWLLEHCFRKDESLNVITEYYDKFMSGMKQLGIVDDAFLEAFEVEEENKFYLLWNKLILLFTSLLEKEVDWPKWSKSDQPRLYVLMAERNTGESCGYLQLAEDWYKEVELYSYASWTKTKRLFIESNTCMNIDSMILHLRIILDEEKSIFQTPGGPRDIVRFTIKLNSFFYNILLYLRDRNELYLSQAKVYCSALDTMGVTQIHKYKTLCKSVIDKIDTGNMEESDLLESIRQSLTELAWMEKNKMQILLR